MNSFPAVSQLISCIGQLSNTAIDKLLKIALDMIDTENTTVTCCPYCGETHFVRNGKKHGKQRFLCKSCGRTFITTTHTIMSMSHQPAAAWKEVIADTLHGNSLDYTAKRLALSHACVFSMRHKLLAAFQDIRSLNPVILEQVAELDETFVLECYKGKKLPDDVGRPARKHGAKARKRGISEEYICINTGVQRSGEAISEAVNRAKPNQRELQQVYKGHIKDGSLLLCDGLRSYSSLGQLADCTIQNVNDTDEKGKGFYNLNTVNNFHSFIKGRYNFYRGVATKYLNRYNALFTLAWRRGEGLVSNLYSRLLHPGMIDYHHSIRDISETGLLIL